MTQAQYAAHRRVSRQYISRLVTLGSIPVDAEGRIDPTRADKALADARDPAREPAPRGVSYHEARRRKELALAVLRELDVRVRKGELVEAEQVSAEWGRIAQRVRDQLLSLPARIAPLLIPPSREDADDRVRTARFAEILKREIVAALTALAGPSPPPR